MLGIVSGDSALELGLIGLFGEDKGVGTEEEIGKFDDWTYFDLG
jgi:hypothetical protein